MTKNILEFASQNVKFYGAIGDGTHDDTTAIQAAIDAAELTNGTVYIPRGLYKLIDALVIDNPISVEGEGIASVWGPMDDAESRIIGCEIPTKSPYLKGSVLLQTGEGKDGLQINVTAETVNLRNFGIRFADTIRFTNTGHGVYCLPPVNTASSPLLEFGVYDSRWDSVFVWGQDGDHYAFSIVNPVLCTLTHLRGYGGGGLEMYGNCAMYSPGNCVVDHPYFALFAGGTAHGIYLHSESTGGKMILNTFIRPHVNALNGPAAWNLTVLDEVNQYTFNADTNALKLMLISPDLEVYNVTCPNTINTNNSMDGFNMLGSQAGGITGTKLSNANITADGIILNADNGAILAELLPTGVIVKTPNGTFRKIVVADNGTISSEAVT
jgi:hypothetical protein